MKLERFNKKPVAIGLIILALCAVGVVTAATIIYSNIVGPVTVTPILTLNQPQWDNITGTMTISGWLQSGTQPVIGAIIKIYATQTQPTNKYNISQFDFLAEETTNINGNFTHPYQPTAGTYWYQATYSIP